MNLAPSSRTGIGRERATVRAYTTLKQDLLDGVIRPGERIVDTDVCARLGISRTPVREALLALERDRLVRVDLRTRASAAATWRVEHRRILAALEARDPDAAAEAVRESFRRDEGLLLARARADLERPATRARDTTGAPAGHHDEGAYG